MRESVLGGCIWPTCMVIGCSDLCPDRPGGELDAAPLSTSSVVVADEIDDAGALVRKGVNSRDEWERVRRGARQLVAETQRIASDLGIKLPS